MVVETPNESADPNYFDEANTHIPRNGIVRPLVGMTGSIINELLGDPKSYMGEDDKERPKKSNKKVIINGEIVYLLE